MARTAAERAADYRWRRRARLDVCLIDVDRQTVLDSGIMSEADWNDAAERRRILSEWLDGELQTLSFGVTA